MQGNEYQQQQSQSGYPEPPPVDYSPPPEVGSAQAPAANPENPRVKAGSCAKCMAIADIILSIICSFVIIMGTANGHIYWPIFIASVTAYTGSITASVLIIVTQPKKHWVAAFWMLWNLLRVLVEISAPIMAFMFRPYTPKGIAEMKDRSEIGDLGWVFLMIAWGIITVCMLATYITFLVFFGRYWCTFCGDETAMEFQPPPTAPAGQPPSVQQQPQNQNQPPPQY